MTNNDKVKEASKAMLEIDHTIFRQLEGPAHERLLTLVTGHLALSARYARQLGPKDAFLEAAADTFDIVEKNEA